MRKIYSLLFVLLLFAGAKMNAQVTVTNPGNTTPALSATYGSLALAIADVNNRTAISGPVTITLSAAQTAPAGGYVIQNTAITGGSNTNRIVFDGGGNTVTAPTPQTSGQLFDGIIKVVGTDFVTIQNFVLNENASNTTTAAGTNNMTEWGIAVLYATSTNGAQNVIIQNNTISLNRTYQNTFGIYSNSTHTATTVTTSATATTTAGGNSGLKIYSNAVSNVNIGMAIIGPSGAADANTGIEIGGTGLGNTLTNFGTTGTFSGFANVSGTVNGILIRNANGFVVSNNSITSSAGGVTAGTLNGIQVAAAGTTPTGTFTNNVNSNTISLQSGISGGSINGINYPSGSASTTSVLNVNGNNFTGLNHSTGTASGAITAILVASANLTTSISNNTFTNLTTNTTGSFTFISHSYSMPTTGTQTIDNNSIVTAFSKTGAGGTVTAFTTNGSSPNGTTSSVTNNNFSNITVTGGTAITGIQNTDGSSSSPAKIATGNTFSNWTGGTSAILGINYGYIGTATSSISSNTITNISSQGNITGIQIGATFSGATTLNIASNTVTGLTSSGTGGSVVGITCSNTSATINVNGNTVRTLSTTSSSLVSGITVSGATNNNVFKNTVCDLSGSAAGSTVTGIVISGSSTGNISNNRIADLRTPAANAGNPLIGINVSGGTTVNVYYNTVFINGTSSGALFGSSAVSVSTTPAVTLRNNIFVNTSSVNGAAFAAAYRRSTTTLTSYGASSNNNLFYAGTPSATSVIFYDGTTAQSTMTAYKSLVASRDASSVTESPNFTSTTCGNADFLKINTGIATQIESGGAPIVGFTDDFEGDTRNASTPDIGADEFAGIAADLTGPSISYSPLANSCAAGATTLSATITDASGVPTSGIGLPVAYYSINNIAGPFTPVQMSFAGANVYTASIATGSVSGDVIYYYVVAQDNAGTPNVSAFPSTGAAGFSINPPAVSTPPSAPSSYTNVASLSGTYTVGAGGNYATLTAAVADYNVKCVSGNVIFSLTDATYPSETFPIVINQNANPGPANTLTISPAAGVAATLSGTSGAAASALIKLNGADYVTIDGLNAGGASLTIENTSVTGGTAVIWISSLGAGTGATNNQVKNCVLKAGVSGTASSTTNTYGIVISGTTLNSTHSSITAGADNDNNTISGNTISKVRYGIYTIGASSANANTGTVISNNIIGPAAFGAEAIGKGGIVIREEDGIQITGNEIRYVGGDYANATSGTDRVGITFGTDASWTPTSVYVKNAIVTKNKIHDIVDERTFSAVAVAIGAADGANATNNTIANNFIYNIKANGTTGDQTVGIGLSAGNGDKVVFNSVYLTGDTDPNASASAPNTSNFGISISSSSVTNPLVRDNIVYMDLSSTSATALKNAAINIPASFAWGTGNSNYNDLYILPANTQSNIGCVGGSGGTFHASLSAWQTAVSQDANSVSIAPVFTSATDLHLPGASNGPLDNLGTPVSGVTDDIDGDTRNVSAPDMGADEFSAPNCTGAVGGTAAGSTAFCGSGTPTITATGYSTGLTSTYQWYSSTTIGDYPNGGTAIGGQTNPASLTTGVVNTTTYFWLRVTCGANSSTDNSTMVTITVNPIPTASASSNSPVCTGGTINLNGTTDIGTSFSWTGPDGFTSTNEDPSIAGAAIAASGVYSFTATLNGCNSVAATTTVVVNQTPSAVTVTPATATICAGGSVALSASGGDVSASGVQLGTGTSVTTPSVTTSALGPNPLQSYYGGAKQQMIVLASELTGLGMGNGSQISAIAYNLIAAETGRTLQNLQVKMSHTAVSAFANTTFLAAGTVVRTAANLSVTTGWNTIPFNSNFTWNGTDNLLIEVNFSNNDAGGSGTSTAQYSTTAFASTLFYRVDNNAAATVDAATTASFAAYTQRNNMRFDFTTPANFTWTPPASGLDVYTGANVNATPAATITYTATSTFNGCSSNNTAVITVNPNYDIVATSGANGSVTPAGTTTLSCDGTGDQTYTITPDPGYLISDLIVDGVGSTPLTTGTYATGGTYDFINVTANHTISATFAVACVNVGITNVSASNPGPLCSGQTTNLTANGVVGTNAVVNWWTGPNGTGTNVGTGTTLNNVGANTYYARVTGDCGTPAEASITINSTGNIFTGTGNWSDNARWSCGAPPASGDAVTIASGANATLDVNFTVSGSLTMDATSTLIVNPTRTLAVDVAATANFNGQSVTFLSDATGTASLGQVNGTLSGATNVTVERYIPNNGFRSWRLLSVPVTTSQTIRQAWQEGDANPLPQQNNLAGRGTQITGVFGTQAAAAAAGFDSTSVQAGMLRWNGASWSNITSTNQPINNFSSYFLYIRGERSRSVTGSVTNSSATTLRTMGTVFTGDQTTSVGANAFALIPNRYPSAIDFTGLTRTGGVNNLFYIWDSKKLNGQSLGAYQTFSGTNGFLCLLSGGSYTLGQPNTTIESGQSFFVTSSTSGTIVLKESAKVSGTNGSLGFRPSAIRSKIDTRLYNHLDEMLDANTVVFDAVYSKAVADEDAPKMGNPGANFAIETDSKLLAVEGTAPVKENDAIQFRMWNMTAGTYKLEFALSNLSLPAGTSAILEDSYLKTSTVLNTSTNTSVSFTVDANKASSAANRFRVVIAKAASINTKAGFSIAPNPIETGVMNVVFSNQVAGKYSVRIVSAAGQLVSAYRLTHAGGNANHLVTLPAVMGNGTYSVEITSPARTRTIQTILVNRK